MIFESISFLNDPLEFTINNEIHSVFFILILKEIFYIFEIKTKARFEQNTKRMTNFKLKKER